MTTEIISRTVSRLKKKYDETDPIRLAKAMGFLMNPESMGTEQNCCKGFFMVQSRMPVITYNIDLPDDVQRLIVAHELGHGVLHRKRAEIRCFHDFDIFGSVSSCEYEANMFAAEYLLEDEEVLNGLSTHHSFFYTAQDLRVPPELLDFKFKMMSSKGSLLLDSPIVTNSSFLKNIPTKGNCSIDF